MTVGWSESQGQGHRTIHGHAPNRHAVLPTPVRLEADGRFAGRGVTIAFLDSGFFPHPDLTSPDDRIVAFHDAEEPGRTLEPSDEPRPSEWHGTQTAVVATGNGSLSDGLFRGLASEARVVLVKVGRRGKIGDDDIATGLEWVLANSERYRIRIVNVSLGGDRDAPLAASRVNMLAEKAIARGLVLVVAAGNSGCSDGHGPLPPATAPSAITVGGYEEREGAGSGDLALYCSSFGFSADGLAKPEVIALARGVAAPILPETPAFRRAEALSRVAAAPDRFLPRLLAELAREGNGLPRFDGLSREAIRYWAEEILREEKIVATHYQHVDGTSFAAPIVSSVVAQMLEANPALTPAAVKRILVSTAERVPGAPALRQGWGVLVARRAVDAAERERHGSEAAPFERSRSEAGRLLFVYHDDTATSVAVAGEFNGWDTAATPMRRCADGAWRAEVPAPGPGRCRYKLVVDGSRWLEDPGHGAKEPDPYGGFDSVITIP